MVQHVETATPEAERRRLYSRLIWPWQVSLEDWKRVARSVAHEVPEDQIMIVAAGLGFYAMMALFPGLVALVSLFGLVTDPGTIEKGLQDLTEVLPPGARELLHDQLHELVTTPSTSLSIGLLVSVLTALWSASSGVDSMVDAMNVAYNKVEKRNWLKRRMMSLLMTLGLIAFTVIAIMLVAVLPSLTGWLGERLDILHIIAIARWPTLALAVAVGLFILYRYAPCRKLPTRSDTTGPIIATVGFLLFSSLFSLYVSGFAAYHKTYGAVGSVVALLFWFYYTSFVILLGAEISAELEGEKQHPSHASPTAAPPDQAAQPPLAQSTQRPSEATAHRAS